MTAAIVPVGIDFCGSDRSPDRFDPDIKPTNTGSKTHRYKGKHMERNTETLTETDQGRRHQRRRAAVVSTTLTTTLPLKEKSSPRGKP